jgi:hypothetical protein
VRTAALVIATSSFLLGSAALRRAWSSSIARTRFAMLALASMLGGAAILIATFGAELGVPVSFAIFSPAALLIVFLGRVVRAGTPQAPSTADPGGDTTYLGHTARVVLSVLLGTCLAVLLAAALAVVLPVDAPTRPVIAIYLLPLLWAAAMAWAISATRLRLPIAVGIAAALAAAAVVLSRLFGVA